MYHITLSLFQIASINLVSDITLPESSDGCRLHYPDVYSPTFNGTFDHLPLFVDVEQEQILLPSIESGERSIRFPRIPRHLAVACSGLKHALIEEGGSEIRSNFSVLPAGSECSKPSGEAEIDWSTTDGTVIHREFQLTDFGCQSSIRESFIANPNAPTSCSGPPVDVIFPTVRGVTERGSRYSIGWNIEPSLSSLVQQIKVCHDSKYSHTLHSSHRIDGANIDARDTGVRRPSFKEGLLYSNVSVANAYKKRSQRARMVEQLSAEVADRMYRKGNYFFARGHLAPDADFVLGELQEATFYYANAVPQWQPFNNGNWKWLEIAIRQLSSRRRQPLWITTGPFGFLQPASNASTKVLHLGPTDSIDVQVPIPAYMYKIVIASSTTARVDVDSGGESSPISAILFVAANVPRWLVQGPDRPLNILSSISSNSEIARGEPSCLPHCPTGKRVDCQSNGWNFDDKCEDHTMACCQISADEARRFGTDIDAVLNEIGASSVNFDRQMPLPILNGLHLSRL